MKTAQESTSKKAYWYLSINRYKSSRAQAKVKLVRAYGGCLGAKSRRRTRSAAKSFGEPQAGFDPEISEWGNPHGVISMHLMLNP